MKCIRIYLFLTLSFFVLGIFAQDNMATYRLKVNEGDSLYKLEEYKKSADAYASGFSAIGRKAYPNDRYYAACSYALSGEKDSALFHLFRLADGNSKYKNLSHISSDSDLKSLYDEKKWGEIIEMVKANKEFAEKDLEKPLVEMLDSVYHMDQDILIEQGNLAKEFGWESEEVKSLKPKIDSLFKITRALVTNLIDERGWVGHEVVGNKGNTAMFLVIQHADLETQLKYLPIMKVAMQEGKANKSSFALLLDRTNLKTGKKQIYGSQIGRRKDNTNYVKALEDPLNVDQRRAEMGLQPLNDYTQIWNFNFDAEEYLKILPEYEKILETEVENLQKVK